MPKKVASRRSQPRLRGRPPIPPEERFVQFTIALPPDLFDVVEAMAWENHDGNRSSAMRQLVKLAIKSMEGEAA